MLTTRKQLAQELGQSVRFIDRAKKYRAFDAVVVEIGDGCTVDRTITVLTSSTCNQERDRARVQRLMRRLRRLGYRELWHSFCHPMDGIGGTVRLLPPNRSIRPGSSTLKH